MVLIISIFLIYLFWGFILILCFLKKNTTKKTQSDYKSISIIIPFKNEENNLFNLFQSIECQVYSKGVFELVFVNDNSTDNSVKLIEEFIAKSNHKIKLFNLKNKQGKKEALLLGIKNSENEIIVHSDADIVFDKNRFETIINYFKNYKIDLLLMPVLYKQSNTLLGKLQDLEILQLVGISVSYANCKMPIMANGANLAYKREFISVFENSINSQESGDDMFFLEKMIEQNANILFSFDKNLIVYSYSQKGIINLINQRVRWAKKSKYLKNKYIITNGILALFINTFWLFVFTLPVVNYNYLLLSFYLIIAKITIDFILNLVYINKLNYYKRYLLLSPLLSIIYPFYVFSVVVISFFYTPEWK